MDHATPDRIPRPMAAGAHGTSSPRRRRLTRLRDQLSAERRALPWVKVEKSYMFDTPTGKATLADLFDGRSQLIVKHFMLAPGQKDGCVGCSFESDHVDGALVHLQNHDVSYVAVARAPLAEIEALQDAHGLELPLGLLLRQRLQLRLQRLVHAGADRERARRSTTTAPARCRSRTCPASASSIKDESGAIFHTYSTFGRGAEERLGTYVLPGPDAEGPQRDRPQPQPRRLGPASRPLRRRWPRQRDRPLGAGRAEGRAAATARRPSRSCSAAP